MGIAGSYLRLVRPKQWTKNGFVLAGVVFAEKAFSPTQVAYALLAFVAFCALSGAVYAANDVLDVEEDRKHPLKRFRPVASGDDLSPLRPGLRRCAGCRGPGGSLGLS